MLKKSLYSTHHALHECIMHVYIRILFIWFISLFPMCLFNVFTPVAVLAIKLNNIYIAFCYYCRLLCSHRTFKNNLIATIMRAYAAWVTVNWIYRLSVLIGIKMNEKTRAVTVYEHLNDTRGRYINVFRKGCIRENGQFTMKTFALISLSVCSV